MPQELDDDPRTPLRRRDLRSAVPRLSRFAREYLLLLPLGAAIALVWAFLDPESYAPFKARFSFVVNDVAMVLFFALTTKEVVEATAPGGVLHPWRRALLPVVVAIVTAVVMALVHERVADTIDEPVLEIGWPITLATDLAVSYFVARLIFRAKHPVIPFVLLIGIASNALGFVIIAVLYPMRDPQLVTAALLMAAAIGITLLLRARRVRSFWPYFLGAGALSWWAFYLGGVHPALALMPIMPLLPHAPRDPGFFVDAAADAKDTLSRFEIWLRYPAQIALFLFGLVNAGVPMGQLEEGTLVLPLAVLIGKPVGVLLGVGVALLLRLHLPLRVHWRELLVIGFLTALGFTVGLFFTAAIIPPGQLRSELSTGVLLTLVAAPLAIGCAWLVGAGRYSSNARRHDVPA